MNKSNSSSGSGGKKKYKAGRSFTKNKSFRENKEGRSGERPKRSFSKDDERPGRGPAGRDGYKKSFNKEKFEGKKKRVYGEERNDFGKDRYGDKPRKPFRDTDERPKKSYRDRNDNKRPFNREKVDERKKKAYGEEERSFKRERRESSGDRSKRNFSDRDNKRPFDKEDFRERKRKPREEENSFGKDLYSERSRKSFHDSDEKPRRSFDDRKDFSRREFKDRSDKSEGFKKPRKHSDEGFAKRVKHDEFEEGRAFRSQSVREDRSSKRPKKSAPVAKQAGGDGLIRLNKYLSNAGVASRREADNLILSGAVKVNGVVVDTLGTKIKATDKVSYGDASVKAERKVYLLLNKPKDYITTVDDPRERKTVMDLIQGACKERVYPVGRLDRNTTGLLLLTNDGELTKKLTHPKFGIKKVYHVSLNKGLKAEDFTAIVEGIELEDGMIKADDLAFVGEGKKEIGIEIHSGRNRIVRRIFEHLGYDVLKLDRVSFAGLTKKDLPRGKYRFLTGKEIGFLQMIG